MQGIEMNARLYVEPSKSEQRHTVDPFI